MSEQYNDEKVRKILESAEIPKNLEPENIKNFLDDSCAVKKRSTIKRNRILRGVSAVAAVAVVCTASIHFIKPMYKTKCNDMYVESQLENELAEKDEITESAQPIAAEIDTMTAAKDYKQVYNYFSLAHKSNAFKYAINGFFGNYENGVADGAVVYEEYADEYAESSSTAIAGGVNTSDGLSDYDDLAEEEKEFSDTYSQETGVLEADIVKTNGDRIFYSTDNMICVADVENGKFINSYKANLSEIIDGINTEFVIQDMYIYNDMLITISHSDFSCIGFADCRGNGNTYVCIFDTSGSMEFKGYYMQDGAYRDVRLMEDGFLYLISNTQTYIDYSETTKDDIAEYVPQYSVNDKKCYVQPEDIMIPTDELVDVYDYAAYTNISGIDLNSENPFQPVDMISIAGFGNTMYCSQQNLYIATGYDETKVTRFAIDDGNITPQASGKVNGYIKDQFSMSEHEGYFRIAVTENVWEESVSSIGEDSSVASNTLIEQNNSVYVLDMDMNIVGSISDFGINETIKSVNFNGNIAYIVTFRQTDPLYAIDLTDPTNPVILDEFKISGYSSYMQNWKDGLMFGFGVEADENTGWETGIKMTMFDNSNPDDLKAVDTVSFVSDGYGNINYSSEAVHERKALYIDPERNIIGIPVEQYNHEVDSVKISYHYKFYSFENGQFVYKGEASKEFTKKQGFDYEAFRRVVYIDGYLYAVSGDTFISVDTNNFAQVDIVQFF